ncbi:HTH-type transcriptional regulator DegA [subsurface metagenome]
MTLAELSKLLNLSPTTVSRVLSGNSKKYRISAQTVKKVQAAAIEHHFKPNQVAQNLRLKRTNTIGLVIPDISNPFFANLASKIEYELRKRGKLVLLCDTNEDTDLETETLSLMMSRKVDGLLIAPVGLSSDHLNNLKELPTVLIDRYYKNLSIPYVSTNNYEGAYQATKYLIERNHKKISCLQGLTNTISNAERVRGFNQAIADFNISTKDIKIIGSDFSLENGYKSANEILSNEDMPTAFFALGNQIAFGALKAIKEKDLIVPDDISLISFDEQPYFELIVPSITTIKQPTEQIGQLATEMLFDIIDKKDVKSQLILAKMIERNSVISI